MSPQPFVLSLPASLLLLLHLHILDYPFANNSEYDHNIFNPRVRGLRDRIKSMEDICYFLVGRLEGRKHHATVLPTYPCLQPSDTTSFRTSLAKYLEIIRHRSLQTLSAQKTTDGNDVNVAWWWKDVVVRKSLLEECSGERFERLLLCLSTHTLLKGAPGPIPLHHIGVTLATLPKDYAALLAISQSEKHAWKRSASLLTYRQNDLRTLREHLAKMDELASTFAGLSTERLLALSDSKFHDILRDHWPHHEGDVALRFLKELGGLGAPSAPSSSSSLGRNEDEIVPKSKDISSQNSAVPSSLPIAAAYHPTKIRKLRAPIFSATKVNVSASSRTGSGAISIQVQATPASAVLSDRLDAEVRMRQALEDALGRAQRVGQELNVHLTEARANLDGRVLDLDLKDDDEGFGVDFKTHPTPDLIVSSSLRTPASEETLESRIDYIRDPILPGFPPILQPRPLFSPAQTTSKLSSRPPQPPTKIASKLTSEASSKALTSKILPVTTKPRPSQAQKLTNTHGKSRRKSIRQSLAHMRRPSLYGGHGLRDEVYWIVDAVRDDDLPPSQPDDDVLTPKPKTRATRLDAHATRRVRQREPSIPMPEPSHALPTLAAPSSQNFLYDPTDSDEDCSGSGAGKNVNDVYYQEAPSMTLRDILLHAADTTQFDLLDDDGTQLDESFGWD